MRRGFAITVLLALAGALLPATAAYALAPVQVRVTPASAGVLVGATKQLAATVTNAPDTTVTWSLRSPVATGSVSATGLFTAPMALPAAPTAVVRATSNYDPSVYAEAVLTLASGQDGSGQGAFVSLPGPVAYTATIESQLGDVNGDGRQDIVRLESCCSNVQIVRPVALLASGSTWTPDVGDQTSVYDGVVYPSDAYLSLRLGDLDEDGDLDAVAGVSARRLQGANYRQAQVWLNNGAGHFAAQAPVLLPYSDSHSAGHIELADWDGDGHLDLLQIDRNIQLSWRKGAGDGTFAAVATRLPSPALGRSISVGDLTGDGRPDLMVNTTSDQYLIANTLGVLLNNGTGQVASSQQISTSYDPVGDAFDVNGDGIGDLVAGEGNVGASAENLARMTYRLSDGAGGFAAPQTVLTGNRPYAFASGHLDADTSLDLAFRGYGSVGVGLLTAPGTFTFRYLVCPTQTQRPLIGQLTQDARADLLLDGAGQDVLVPGTSDVAPVVAVEPGVTHVDATLSTTLTATVRNSPVVPHLTWSATNGSVTQDMFEAGINTTYTAPSSAAVAGTPATVTASLDGTALTASLGLTVVNERFQYTTMSARAVGQLLTDPTSSATLYAATDDGVYRSTNGGATFAKLGTTGLTGTAARQLTLVSNGGTRRLLATFGGTGLFSYDLASPTDWVDSDGGVLSATGLTVSAVTSSSQVFATSGGTAYVSADAGASWAPIDSGTTYTVIFARGANAFWALRSSGVPVVTGTLSGNTATVTDRPTGYPGLGARMLTVDPSSPHRAWVGLEQTGVGAILRSDDDGATWTTLGSVPALVDAIAPVPGSSTGLLVLASGSLLRSASAGASFYDVRRGFAGGVTVLGVGHRTDGLAVVGTTAGLYTPVDPSPPTAPALTASPSGSTGPTGPFVLSWSAVAGAASYRCSLDGTLVPCTSPYSVDGPLTDGGHTLAVLAIGATGDESPDTAASWTVDAVAPAAPSLSGGPTGTVTSATATFGVTYPADSAATRCSLDSATAVTCPNPLTYSGLADGSHTLSVRALDTVGNVSTAATRTWTVDTTPPTYPTFTDPSSVTAQTSYFFQWEVDATATYECVLDTVIIPCDAGNVAATLTDGSHSFSVLATDVVGNSVTHAVSWVIDTTAPTVLLSSGPPALTNSTSLAITLTPSSSVAYLQCTVDNGYVPCLNSGYSTTGIAAGAHTFLATPYTQEGTAGSTLQVDWTVDTTAPTAVQTAPTTLTGATAVVRLATSEAVKGGSASTVKLRTGTTVVASTLACQTSTGVVASCTGTTVRRLVVTPSAPLVPGQLYNVLVTGVTDLAGNALAAPAVFRASTSEQETSAAAKPGWTRVVTSAAAGGAYHVSSLTGASASYAFTGTSATVTFRRGPLGGQAALYDGATLRKTVDLYASTAGALAVAIPLNAGSTHLLKVVVKGTKAAASHGTDVAVDALKVGTTSLTNPAWIFSWPRAALTSTNGYAYEQRAGSTFTFTFRGRGIDWVTLLGKGMGKAKVTVTDPTGTKTLTYDNYKSTTASYARRISGLTDTVHTLTITVLGTRSTAATGTRIAVDRFGVLA